MKKRIALLLAGVLAVTSLVACGGGNDTNNNNEPQTNEGGTQQEVGNNDTKEEKFNLYQEWKNVLTGASFTFDKNGTVTTEDGTEYKYEYDKKLEMISLYASMTVNLNITEENGVYKIPCKVNGLRMKFIFDTGASDVSISSIEAAFMLKNGYLKDKDIVGKAYYSTATGEIHEGTKVILREIKIGDAILRDVEASVTHSQQAPLLLGQSVMERFGVIAIDNTTSKLTIKQR